MQAPKRYIGSSATWLELGVNPELVDALQDDDKLKPTRVQEQTLKKLELKDIANPDRRKINLLIRAINGSGKTLAFLIPILNSLRPGMVTAKDKQTPKKLIEKEIFYPQAIIIIHSAALLLQIEEILKVYQKKLVDKIKFTIGRMDNEIHCAGDIVLAMMKSFSNRESRGNFKFDNCLFAVIDEVDDLFGHQNLILGKVLGIFEEARKSTTNIITCSATMKGEFIKFYKTHCPDATELNVNREIESEGGGKVSIQGVSCFYMEIGTTIQDKGKYIVCSVLNELYSKADKEKAQVFVFFDNSDEAASFFSYFKSVSSDLTSPEGERLQNVIAEQMTATVKINDEKKELTVPEKRAIMERFMNREIHVLISNQMMSRGVDVRSACFVINVGIPMFRGRDEVDPDTFLHRIGRTGRHNDRGVALILINKGQAHLLDKIRKVHNLQIKDLSKEGNLERLLKEVSDAMLANSKDL